MEVITSLFTISGFLKFFLVVITIIVFVFSLLVYKQISNINAIIKIGDASSTIRKVSLLIIFVTFCLLLTAIAIL